MRVLLSVVASLLLLAGAHATALTTILKAGEKTCYYADVDGVGEKVRASLARPLPPLPPLLPSLLAPPPPHRTPTLTPGFYFAIQSGGNFEIDWVVMDPEDKIVIEGDNERQGDFIFTAKQVGEYSFCFANDGGSADKLIDFEWVALADLGSS